MADFVCLIQELRSNCLHQSNKCKNRDALCSVSESRKQNSPANSEAMFVLNCWLEEFLLCAFANHFELRCVPQQLMLLYYKICLYFSVFHDLI